LKIVNFRVIGVACAAHTSRKRLTLLVRLRRVSLRPFKNENILSHFFLHKKQQMNYKPVAGT